MTDITELLPGPEFDERLAKALDLIPFGSYSYQDKPGVYVWDSPLSENSDLALWLMVEYNINVHVVADPQWWRADIDSNHITATAPTPRDAIFRAFLMLKEGEHR